MPEIAPLVLVFTSTLPETLAMLARASPRKPRVDMPARSSARLILEVACFWKARGRSRGSMPQPSSVTRIKPFPPSATSTRILPAPASMEFSTSSLTTDAGRSMTSPAAILLMVSASRSLILTISIPLYLPSIAEHLLVVRQPSQGL